MAQYAPAVPNLTRSEAILYCFLCTHNGHQDWRLPTRNELSVYSGKSRSLELYMLYHSIIDSRAEHDTVTLIPVRDL